MSGPQLVGTLPLWWDASSQEGSSSAPASADGYAVRPASGAPSLGVDLPPGVDVCIVGGGFTGLWTAYYLLLADPSLDVLVLEAEHVGFGASGRNGGWVSALYPVSLDTLAASHGAPAAAAMGAALRETVVEVGRVAEAERIDCDFHLGGTLIGARTLAQVQRAQAGVSQGQRWDPQLQWLGPVEAAERVRMQGLLGASFYPSCARVQPRRLVDGLAAAVRRLGGRIVEGVRVTQLGDHRVMVTDGAVVTTRHTVLATEAWTATMPGRKRQVAPVYSLMIATEPLPASVWDEIGLAGRETFADHRHVVIYGQRTADDRIAFGGRGAPYHLRSAIKPEFDSEPKVFADIEATLHDLFPATAGYAVTHRWGGPLGIPRDWHPQVSYDPVTGVGSAGGYVGDGVAATNLAGRTLADLIRGVTSPLTSLPWVGHRSPAWEPEPLRWVGVNAGLKLADWADAEEVRTGRPARLGRLLTALTGH